MLFVPSAVLYVSHLHHVARAARTVQTDPMIDVGASNSKLNLSFVRGI